MSKLKAMLPWITAAVGATAVGYTIFRDERSHKGRQDLDRKRFVDQGITFDLRELPDGQWEWEVIKVTEPWQSKLLGVGQAQQDYDTASRQAKNIIAGFIENNAPKGAGGRPLPPTPTPDPVVQPVLEPYETYTYGPYTVDLTGLSTGNLWRVFPTDQYPAAEPREGMQIGSGIEEAYDDAKTAANAFIDSIGAPEGSTNARMMHGLRVSESCDSIEVVDVVDWVAWASPRVKSRAHSMNINALAKDLFIEVFPECDWTLGSLTSGGQPIATRLEEADSPGLQLVRDGQPVPLQVGGGPDIFERAAAALVGATAPDHDKPRFAYRGHIVTVSPDPAGWAWRVWPSGRAGPPVWSGKHAAAPGAAAAARSAVDNPPVRLAIPGLA